MLTGMLTFLFLLIALLAIPVTLTFRVSWRQAFRNDIELQWGFGLIRVGFPSPQSKQPSAGTDESRPTVGRSKHPSRKKRNAFAAIRRKAFRRRMIRFVSDLWHAIDKKNVGVRIRIGLGDPADTGQLWAIVGPIAAALASAHEASIKVEPEFLGATLEMDSSGSIRLIPLRIIYLTIALLLSPTVWQGLSRMRVPG